MSERTEERLSLRIAGSDAPPAELPRAGMLVIGRSAEKAGLVVDGQGVADVHCAIGRTKRGGFALKDLGSDYGTFLNGERITQARLRAGDQILIGSRRLQVVGPGEAAAPAPEPQGPAAAPPPAPAPSAPAAPAAPLPEIPGYRLVRPLGRGAMGAVYLAVQESLDREVALKVLPPRLARDEDFVRRFQAEARAAAALNHPNVVTVHDVGQSDGRHYLTMEYMDRGSLEERVAQEGKLSWHQVLEVLHDAASGLVYAESRGIVHRDIKPANLMQNHTGATKIADLGLATQVEAESQESEAGERKIFGTPHFISPEQVRGQKADCRSDLYSLGATAYRLLTGHTPYEGASTRDILRAKLREDPRPIHELAEDLPAEAEALVARLMQRDPEARHPSASALLREVAALRAGASGAGGTPVVVVKRGGLGLKLAAAAVLVAAAGAAVFLSGPDEDDGAPGGDGRAIVSPVGNGPEPTGTVEPEDAGAAVAGAPADDDAAEQLFELKAKNAYLELGQRDLPRAELRDALRALAEEYKGTTVATSALEQAGRIEAELRLEERQASERENQLGAIFTALRAASGLDTGFTRAADALRAMDAVPGQEAWGEDPVFRARRSALEDEVLARALAGLEQDMAELAKLERQGRFEEMRPTLVDVLGRTELPDLPDGRAPQGAVRVLEIRREVRAKLDSLSELAERFQSERSRDDARAVARALRGPGGLEDELARLAVAEADLRLAKLEEELFTDPEREWVRALRSDLAAGRVALRAVADSYDSWRRKSMPDPRPGRSGIAEVRGASETGLVVDGSDGLEEVPWSVLGAQPGGLHNLFYERLARDYTAEELAGIAALLRLSAVVAAVREASEMFDSGGNAVFTERESRALRKLLDEARDWARKAGRAEALEREIAAVDLLAAGLRHASEGAWAVAVSDLERLLVEMEDTLLVRLLSDGSGLPEPAAEPATPPGGTGANPAEPPAPPGEGASDGSSGGASDGAAPAGDPRDDE